MQPRDAPGGHPINGDVTAAVLDAIRSVRFGSVEIVIHDGRVVGIERREKVRIDRDLVR
jgi:hypothetical protein